MTNPEPLGALAAARVLGITRRQVLRLVDRGRLKPLTKLEGSTGAYVFDADDVAALAAGSTPNMPSELR